MKPKKSQVAINIDDDDNSSKLSPLSKETQKDEPLLLNSRDEPITEVDSAMKSQQFLHGDGYDCNANRIFDEKTGLSIKNRENLSKKNKDLLSQILKTTGISKATL